MKIVILNARFPPTYLGGAEIAAFNIARQLSNRGHDVHVIAILDKNASQEKNSDFNVHRVKTIEFPLIRNIVYSIKCARIYECLLRG